jgi:hypothetical protein
LGNTLAAAVRQTLCSLLPNVEDQSITADVVLDDTKPSEITVWLSETESGGIGVITALQDLYAADPLKVLSAFYRCLQPGDYEQLDRDLQRVLELSLTDSPIVNSLQDVRDAKIFQSRITSNENLKTTFSSEGFLYSHSFSSVLHSRILRPGSSRSSDEQLLQYINRWLVLESGLGLELPIHITSFILAYEETVGSNQTEVFEKLCDIHSRLWVRGDSVRQESLKYYNPFDRENNRTERLLGAMACVDRTSETRFTDDGWIEVVHQYLRQEGQVDLIVDRIDRATIPTILATLHVNPIDIHGLFLFPRVISVSRRDDQFRFRLELSETLY